MKDLMIKEINLARHPTMFIFPFLGLMMLIPSYPYFIAFFYTCLSVFFIFLQGRENKDILFTVSLPVRKRDTVKARCWMIALIEVFQILVSVPFAVLGSQLKVSPLGNEVGIEANVAFFGLVFIMFALFNGLFIPIFYRTAYKAGVALIVAGSAVMVFMMAAEVSIQLVPALKTSLDTLDPVRQIGQLPILAAGIVLFGLGMLLTCRLAIARFERVDL